MHVYVKLYNTCIYALTYVTIWLSNSRNTLMKLAKGSKRRIKSFENAAHRHLQCSSLSSKLSSRDDVVSECLYICYQNYDQRVHFHCVAISDEDWMFWNFMINNQQIPQCQDSHFKF
jgi:hypothetical protein